MDAEPLGGDPDGSDDVVPDAGPATDAGVQQDAAVVPWGYWAGVRRRLAQSPAGHRVAVSCHNCYRQDLSTSADNLQGTVVRVEAAQSDGADIVELDVKHEGDDWYVGHDDDGSVSSARLTDVLSDAPLTTEDHLLFVEIKEQTAVEQHLHELLDLLTSSGTAGAGRFLIVRAFEERSEQLWIVERMLDAGEFAQYAPYVRTQVLYTQAQAENREAVEAMIEFAVESGADGVEFNHQTAAVHDLLDFAISRGLGTNVWTFSATDGADKCREFRDLADALTTDSRLDLCRAAVEAP